MKKLIISLSIILLLVLLVPAPLYAFPTGLGKALGLCFGLFRNIYSRDTYTFGEEVEVSSNVDGTLVSIGTKVSVDSQGVGEDFFAVAKEYLELNTDIGNDAIILGNGKVFVESNIENDLIATCGYLEIDENSTIGGHLIVNSDNIIINGEVKRDALLRGGEVFLDGKIGNNVRVEKASKLTIGDNAVINGDLIYKEVNDVVISKKAKIIGEVDQPCPYHHGHEH